MKRFRQRSSFCPPLSNPPIPRVPVYDQYNNGIDTQYTTKVCKTNLFHMEKRELIC
jgi:hypothetical protein